MENEKTSLDTPAHLLERIKDNDPVKFNHFPGPVRSAERRRKWIIACHRGVILSVPKTAMFVAYILLGAMNQRDPDPISHKR